MERNSPKKSFWNKTNIIIILVLVVAFTILALQFDDDQNLPDANRNNESGNRLETEMTSLIVNKSNNVVHFVGYAINDTSEEKTFTIDFYYNDTFLDNTTADGEALPKCDICDNHAFMHQVKINTTEAIDPDLLYATINKTGNKIPIIDSALQIDEQLQNEQ